MKFFDSIHEEDFENKDLRISKYFIIIAVFATLITLYALFFVDLVNKVEVRGTIVPYKYKETYSQVEGSLKAVYKNDGDLVSNNDLILEIENDEIVKEYFTSQNKLIIQQRENMRLIPEVNCSVLEKQIAMNSVKMAESQFQLSSEHYNSLKIYAKLGDNKQGELILAIDPKSIGKSIPKNTKLCILNESKKEWKILTNVSDKDIHYIDLESIAQIKTPMLRNRERNEFNGKVIKIYLYKSELGYPVEIKADTEISPPLFSTTTIKIIGKKQRIYEYIVFDLLQ